MGEERVVKTVVNEFFILFDFNGDPVQVDYYSGGVPRSIKDQNAGMITMFGGASFEEIKEMLSRYIALWPGMGLHVGKLKSTHEFIEVDSAESTKLVKPH